MKITKKELVEIIKEEVEKVQLDKGVSRREPSELELAASTSERNATNQEAHADEYASVAEREDKVRDIERYIEMAYDLYVSSHEEYERQFLVGKELMNSGRKGIARVNIKIAQLDKNDFDFRN